MPLPMLLEQFMDAPSKLVRYRLVLEHPVLLSGQAQTALDGRWRAAWDQRQLHAVERVSRWKLHLRQCAADGPGPAMFGWPGGGRPPLDLDIPPPLLAAMAEAAALAAPRDMPRRILLLEQALAKLDAEQRPYLWGELTQMLAWSCMNVMGEERMPALDRARQLYEGSWRMFTREAFPAEWAYAHHCLGALGFQQQTSAWADNLERALVHFQTALAVRTQQAMPVEWAYTCKFMALAYQYRQADHQRSLGLAADRVRQSLDVFTHDQFPVEWAMSMSSLARALLMYQGGDRAANIDQAIEACQNALRVCVRETMPAHWTAIMNDLARAWLERQRGDRAANLEEAISLTESALSAIAPDSQPADWVRLKIRLAAAYRNRLYGDRGVNLEKAIAAYTQAAAVAQQQRMTSDWALIENNLALLFLDRLHGSPAANAEAAISACGEALTVRSRDALPESWARTKETLGNAFLVRELGDPADNSDRAVRAFEDALLVFTEDSLPVEWAHTTVSLARALLVRRSGDPENNARQAAAACRRALRVQVRGTVPVDWAETMRVLAQTYLAGPSPSAAHLEQAAAALRLSAEVFHPRIMPQRRLDTLTDLAEVLVKSGDFQQAAAVFAEIRELDGILQIHEVTQNTQSRRIQDTARLYALAAWCQAKLGQFQRAVEWAEYGRTRVLRNKMARDQALFRAALAPEDRHQFQRIDARLRGLEAEQRQPGGGRRPFLELAEEAQDVWDSLTALVAKIRRYLPEFLGSGMSYQQVAGRLPPGGDAAFILFICTSSGTAAAVLAGTPAEPIERLVFLDHMTSAALLDLTDRWHAARSALEQRLAALPYVAAFDGAAAEAEQRGAVEEWDSVAGALLAEIHAQLLAPALAAAGPARRLVLLPHGPMHALPLHAAITATGPVRYLQDSVQVSYAPSFALIEPSAPVGGRPPSLLGVGDPTGDLPHSKDELQDIAGFFASALLLEGREATVARVTAAAAGHDVLHFACHGDLDFEQPFSSCLYLAPEASEALAPPAPERAEPRVEKQSALRLLTFPSGGADGPPASSADRWTLSSILRDLRIPQARAVVLSACKSGLCSPSRMPDEYLGLAAGFLAAGAGTVISSLWAVPDHATRLLMSRFYAHWLAGGLPPAAALRQAQADIRALPAYRSPYYWAAFHASGW